MKPVIIIILFNMLLITNSWATEKVTITKLATGQSCYNTGVFDCVPIVVWCINGYKWLQTGSGSSASTSQMSQNNLMSGNAQAIPCKN